MVTVSSKFQITLPSDLTENMKIKAGDKVVFVEEGGKYVLMKLDDLIDEVLEVFKDLDETDKEFREGFKLRLE